MLDWPARLARRLVRNPLYKLLSFVIALLAWVYVQSNSVEQVRVKAKVAPIIGEGLMTVEPLPATILLTIGGTKLATRRAEEADLSVQVDLSELGAGVHGLDFSTFAVQNLPPGVFVLQTQPQSVRFEIDAVESRNVAIEPAVIGEPAEGYTVGEIVLEPSVVEVRGPRRRIAALRAVNTRPIDVSGLHSDHRVRFELDLPRSVVVYEEVDPEAVVIIEPLVETRTIGGVPVQVWNHYGWRPTEPTLSVTLEGPSAALRVISPDDVVAFVHLPDPPTRARYEAPFGPTEGLRLRILSGTTDPDVSVTRVTPPRVEVYRALP